MFSKTDETKIPFSVFEILIDKSIITRIETGNDPARDGDYHSQKDKSIITRIETHILSSFYLTPISQKDKSIITRIET